MVLLKKQNKSLNVTLDKNFIKEIIIWTRFILVEILIGKEYTLKVSIKDFSSYIFNFCLKSLQVTLDRFQISETILDDHLNRLKSLLDSDFYKGIFNQINQTNMIVMSIKLYGNLI